MTWKQSFSTCTGTYTYHGRAMWNAPLNLIIIFKIQQSRVYNEFTLKLRCYTRNLQKMLMNATRCLAYDMDTVLNLPPTCLWSIATSPVALSDTRRPLEDAISRNEPCRLQ